MNIKKILPYVIASGLVLFTAITFYIIGSKDSSEPVTAASTEHVQEENEEVIGNGDGGETGIVNSIENNINGEYAQVDNSIENNVNNGFNNEIDNSVINNIDVKMDVNITNNVVNNIENTQRNENNSNEEQEQTQESDSTLSNDTTNTVWGVDSASLTTDEMLACVRENFGDPEIWGRYLGDKDGVSYGLTNEEVELLHSNDIQVLVIWNHFTDATGYEKGQSEAYAAIEMAREFGIPEGVALFANVEPIYPIDSEFLLGWYDTISESEYNSGVYGIFNPEEELYVAYEAAVEERAELLENNFIWTAAPYEGITTEGNAPEYSPEAPEGALVAGWQYGIDAEACNIDTNVFNSEAFDVFW